MDIDTIHPTTSITSNDIIVLLKGTRAERAQLSDGNLISNTLFAIKLLEKRMAELNAANQEIIRLKESINKSVITHTSQNNNNYLTPIGPFVSNYSSPRFIQDSKGMLICELSPFININHMLELLNNSITKDDVKISDLPEPPSIETLRRDGSTILRKNIPNPPKGNTY